MVQTAPQYLKDFRLLTKLEFSWGRHPTELFSYIVHLTEITDRKLVFLPRVVTHSLFLCLVLIVL